MVAFDVNGTLSDMQGLAPRFESVGAPPGLVDLWFAQTLRDGFALSAAGAYADFSTVATACLAALLEDVPDLRGSPRTQPRTWSGACRRPTPAGGSHTPRPTCSRLTSAKSGLVS